MYIHRIEKINIKYCNSNKGYDLLYLVADHTSNQLLNNYIIVHLVFLSCRCKNGQFSLIFIIYTEFTHKSFCVLCYYPLGTYTLDIVFVFQLYVHEKTHRPPIDDRVMVDFVDSYDFFLPALCPSLAFHTCLPLNSDDR